ncbi:hypothetical protein F961_00655 [Acinetobacter baumannii NIPH 60]|nr:hypothetical protein F961_00655 [Acinetobacter baumannii NIPH 60]
MVQPINYMLDVANPVQTTLQGFQLGGQPIHTIEWYLS